MALKSLVHLSSVFLITISLIKFIKTIIIFLVTISFSKKYRVLCLSNQNEQVILISLNEIHLIEFLKIII